ncbi:MAG: thioredoxin domain-containing protein [Candidatus Omnitrophica bacterium]|nr:thioredoxin domain-containing protein [Candidatus Omnitrophota bacterium]
MADEATHVNRLAKEKSPYLLQHAHNPVDWFPWGEEAFEKARRENKPIFLSIGYSTCHWCHVMEEESFTNPLIAQLLNDHFISIKVDREERPDVDHIYMQAVMAMTGSGGWPMSIFLTPDLKPFYGGTYFPPEDRWGRSGFTTLLKAIQKKWETDREGLLRSGEQLAQAIQEEVEHKKVQSHPLSEETLKLAFEQLESRFDPDKGGFGEAPKFPQSHGLSFLLRYWKRIEDVGAYGHTPLNMVTKTLDEMARGGMYDQLGGGFHRYSTDSEWRVPHFEKMLYDQAILSKTYLEAYQATGNPEYAQVAREIFDYVLRDMTPPPALPLSKAADSQREQEHTLRKQVVGVTGPEGAFYSAEDADSAPNTAKPKEKKEGAFYVWTQEEIEGALGKEKAEIFKYYFGIEANGNALHDPQGELKNKNVLYVAHSLNEAAKKFGKTEAEIESLLNDSKKILFDVRAKRMRPHLDDKVLTDWNGLMISSLAFGSRVLGEDRYREAAKRAADFILARMKIKEGRLLHRYRDGEVSIPGFLEDYAFLIQGLIDLYQATFEVRYLEEAKSFTHRMIDLFWDEKSGGFFFTAKDAEKLLARTKELYDGAIPSGNSMAILSLIQMARLTVDQDLEARAQKGMETFSDQLAQYPAGFTQMMIALDFVLGPSREIVIAADSRDSKAIEFAQLIYSKFLPNKVILFHPSPGEEAKRIEAFAPFLKVQTPLGGKATVYVCKNYVCDLPVTETDQLNTILK